MRNFEKAKEEGWKVLERHPRADLHASELRALMEQYEGQNVYTVITDMWLAGLSVGYKFGQADAAAKDQTSVK